MASSSFSFQQISIPKIPRTPDGILLVLVAMAVNDLLSADTFVSLSRESEFSQDIKIGLGMYAIRLQIAHLAEVFKCCAARPSDLQSNGLLHLIKCSRGLDRYLAKLTPEGNSILAFLEECLPGGCDHTDFMNYIMRVRNKVTFHYDERETSAALSLLNDSMKKPVQAMRRSIVIGHTRLAFADAVVDREVFHVIWGVDPKSVPDPQTAVDNQVEWCQKRAIAFTSLGLELCWRYFKDHAGV